MHAIHGLHAFYSNPRTPLASAEDLIAEMDTSGVDASVAFSFGWTDPGLIEEINSYVIDAMRRYPGRIYGMAVIAATAGSRALHELERCAQAGMIGLGELMPHGQGYQTERYSTPYPFIDIVRHYQLLVLSHCSEPVGHSYPGKGDVSVQDIVTFLTAFPDIRFIAAHWGGGLPFYLSDARNSAYQPHMCGMIQLRPSYLYREDIFPTVVRSWLARTVFSLPAIMACYVRSVLLTISDRRIWMYFVEMILGKNARIYWPLCSTQP